MVSPQLVEWVRKYKSAGYTVEQLYNYLTTNGYNINDVNEAIFEASQPVVAQPLQSAQQDNLLLQERDVQQPVSQPFESKYVQSQFAQQAEAQPVQPQQTQPRFFSSEQNKFEKIPKQSQAQAEQMSMLFQRKPQNQVAQPQMNENLQQQPQQVNFSWNQMSTNDPQGQNNSQNNNAQSNYAQNGPQGNWRNNLNQKQAPNYNSKPKKTRMQKMRKAITIILAIMLVIEAILLLFPKPVEVTGGPNGEINEDNAQIEDGPQSLLTACDTNTCFSDKFLACEAASITLVMSSNLTMYYEIIGPENGMCNIRSYYTTNPDPAFLGKEMTCAYNNSIYFEDAFKDMSLCQGELYDMISV